MIDFIFFWYVFIGLWILLALSILFAFYAFKKTSWKLMFISVVLSIPNTVSVLIVELEKVMYLLLVWFIIQLALLYFLYRKRHLLRKNRE